MNNNFRQPIDWLLRSVPQSQGTPNRFRPTAIVELPGSARTRAPSQSRFPPDLPESVLADVNGEAETPRVRVHRTGRTGSYNATGGGTSNDGNNNNLGNGGEEQYQDPGARFYPGYIPEILITRKNWCQDDV